MEQQSSEDEFRDTYGLSEETFLTGQLLAHVSQKRLTEKQASQFMEKGMVFESGILKTR